MTPEHVDESGILTVPERFGVEGEIDIGRADVRHLGFFEQQPRHRAADNGELPLEAA